MQDTRCLLPHLSLAVQNYGDICACNLSKQSYELNDRLYTVDQSPLENIWSSPTRQQLIHSLENGQRHEGCRACWEAEDAGKVSARQMFNHKFAHLVPHQDQPRIMIIKPGNTCNAACRMCNPATSSSWYQDDFKRKKLQIPELKFNSYIKNFESVRNSFNQHNPNFWPTVNDWYENLEYLEIYGGEPWLISGLWSSLQHAVSSGHSKHIDISLNTNASNFNQEYLDLLCHFRSIVIKLSFDSHIKSQFEYIRHKLNFDICVRNSQRFIKFAEERGNFSISVICSPSNLNIGNLDEIYFGLTDLLKINVDIDNFVTGPDEYYDIRHLPRDVKQKLKIKFSQDSKFNIVTNFMAQTIPGCSLWWPKFCLETDRLDDIRGQKFQKVMPDWYTVLAPYWVYDQHHPEWF